MTQPALRPLLLALSIALLPAGAALAGSGLYLDIPSIPGESVDPGYAGKIDVFSLSWGVSLPVTRLAGAQPTVGKPNVQDISWVQGLDSSIVPLFSRITGASSLASARFDEVKPGAKGPFLSLTAERATLSSMSFGGSSGQDGSFASSTLSPSAVSLRYDPGAQGGTGPVLTTRYDLLNNTTQGPSGREPTPGQGTTPATAGLYMRLGSGATAIAGDSRAVGYENWIPIYAFSMGTSVSLGPRGQLSSEPSVQELSWTQAVDAAAPAVLFDLLQGQAIGQVTIEQVSINRNGLPVTVMQQALNDVIFSSFALSTSGAGSGAGSASFSGSMSFASFSQTLWPVLGDGSRGGPASVGYDVVNSRSIPGFLASNVAGFGNGSLNGLPPAPPPPIPEPQTWALMLAGLASLLGLARRRAAA